MARKMRRPPQLMFGRRGVRQCTKSYELARHVLTVGIFTRAYASNSTEVLGERAPLRILLEASTKSEWVARCLEALGRDDVGADPNFAPMYATRTRKVKTDRRDARALA